LEPVYRLLSRRLPLRPPAAAPRRIVLIRPCCIGDVVMATAALTALRRRYPNAHITWAVGGWSRQAVENHPDLDAILDSGAAANPAGTLRGLVWFAGRLRAGRYDMAVSLVRSPLMSAAVLLSGIACRVGLDSGGRGFGYNLRVPVDPAARRHEAAIYLDAVARLGASIDGIYPSVGVGGAPPVPDATTPYLVVNPSGGKNPGAQMDAKRYPPKMLAELVHLLRERIEVAQVVVVAGPGDAVLAEAVRAALGEEIAHTAYVGTLTFAQIGALAAGAVLYIGNDTGLTHYAAAAGAATAMLLGPTDPLRYGPFAPNAVALWRQYPLPQGGFAAGPPLAWDWRVHGISPAEAAARIFDAGVVR
jgi:ADP-heptose:LPS heptosyltransferase